MLRQPQRRPRRRASSASVQENKDAVTQLNSSVTDLKNANAGLAQTISDTKKDITDKLESPLAIHYKGITITPVAFFAFEGVCRSAFDQLGHQYSVQLHSVIWERRRRTRAS